MKKVSELEGAELDFWVEMFKGYKHLGAVGFKSEEEGSPFCRSEQNDWWQSSDGEYICGSCYGYPRHYSSNWELGGELIEEYWAAIHYFLAVWHGNDDPFGMIEHDKLLIWFMRCIVASKYGNEVNDE